jgi:hypothetical protein
LKRVVWLSPPQGSAGHPAQLFEDLRRQQLDRFLFAASPRESEVLKKAEVLPSGEFCHSSS